jgi:hypothetical protein
MTTTSNEDLYDEIMSDPSWGTDHEVLAKLTDKYGNTISKDEYIAKLEEISETVVKEWEDEFEHYTEYADGTIVVDTKAGVGVKKCGWCGTSDLADYQEEPCDSCRKLPQRICENGSFSDSKIYVKSKESGDRNRPSIKQAEYRYTINDEETSREEK